MLRISNGVREKKSVSHNWKNRRGRLDLSQLDGNWAVKPCLTNFIYPYMKANPAIDSIHFSILLAKRTKCATKTLLSTTFRQSGALVGVSDCNHKFGSLAPCNSNLALPALASGLCIPAILIISLPEKLDNFSRQDHDFLSPAPF